MSSRIKKYKVSDPAYYDPLIADQKKRVKRTPRDPMEWLELGRLHESKIDMINFVSQKNLGIRYFYIIYIFLLSLAIPIVIWVVSSFPLFSLKHVTISSLSIIILSILSMNLWLLRYPLSGKRYFKKAISLDPRCAEAYMHLGFITLRRYQKRKGCMLLEQALRFDVDNKRIERNLKTIYAKEFISFFNKKIQKEVRLQELIDHQLEEVKTLRAKVSSLENLTESLSCRADQAKWEVNHKTKQLTKEMNERLYAIQKEYENQITDIKGSFESQENANDMTQKDFIRLTTEIMEAKAELEAPSFVKAHGSLEAMLGSDIWQALLPQTRTYLATAEHTFCILSQEKGSPDYSLIGMELCKALEAEINRTLVAPFVHYLNGNKKEFLELNRVGESKGKPRYFTYLAQMVDQRNYPETTSLTLGQYHFVLKRALKGEYAFNAYNSFFNRIHPAYMAKNRKSNPIMTNRRNYHEKCVIFRFTDPVFCGTLVISFATKE